MKQKKETTRMNLRSKMLILCICIMMVTGQFYVFAQSDSYIQASLSEQTDIHTQKITIASVSEDIRKVALYKDGNLIETKAVSGTMSFDVHQNGDYTLIGWNDAGAILKEEVVHVDMFENLMIEEDKLSHTVTVVSRYPSTMAITVNKKENLGAIEIATGVYQATYKVSQNGTYTFYVVDAKGSVLGNSSLRVSDIPNVTKTGETIISNVDDLKHIVTDPSGSFLLDQDIELKEDTLSGVNFTGTLNGNGHTISGTMTLFQSLQNALVKNIVIKGQLAQSSIDTNLENCGFYIEGTDKTKEYAVIKDSENTKIKSSFVLMNIEGRNTAGFILKGTGIIEDSYVSGYLQAEEEVYGFGKEIDIKNSYITASIKGKKRTLFSTGERESCFYDAQINDLEDEKATPYFTKDLISGDLNNKAFKETKGNYPKIIGIDNFKKEAQKVSALSVVSVSTSSNLSALENSVDYEETKEIEWEKNSDEIKAESNKIVNRFSLKAPKTISDSIAGLSTTEKTTQITYPVTMGRYYKVVKSLDIAPELPASHAAAINTGWKLIYWTGTNTASGLDWNTNYTIYSTDLTAVIKGETIKTNYGKNGGKLTLTGNYDVGQEMTAELTQTNIMEGQWRWETASRLDASSWDVIAGAQTNTYIVTDNEKGKYLRVYFIADETKGYRGELKAVTSHTLQEAITKVNIENRTSKNATMTINDQLVASIEPSGKDGEATFTWYHEGESDAIATGRNYTLKKEDIGKKLYVTAVAKEGGELKGDKSSALTETVQAIQCAIPDISKLKEKAHDDITVTLTMDTDEGLYQFGYATREGGEITACTTLSRAQTELTMTGLSANTVYYIYVRQIGENGYVDSKWSTSAYSFKTDAEHVRGDVIISGEVVYNRTLTAEITNKPAEHKGDFVWYRLDENEERILDSQVIGNSYTLKKEDIGHKIEAVYEGKDGYAGEVTNVSETVSKEEKAAPQTNLITGTVTDREIPITMPANTDGEKYILGISATQNGIPIEQQEDGSVKEFTAGESYTIRNLERDTKYYLFIRYAANETHQKSDWIEASKAVSKTTMKKEFSGTITFTYEMESGKLIKGQSVKATLNPADSTFNYKGTWTWTKSINGIKTPINTFTISSDRKSTSYLVPEEEDTGAVYEVKFEANVGYYGSQTATTTGVQEPVKGKYEKPDVNSIVMESIDDESIRVMMHEGEGLYQFYYKEEDVSAADSMRGFVTKLFTGDDGYIKADKVVGANVELVIEGLKRDTRYIVKVERVGDAKFETSDAVYSSEATTEYTAVKTEKTEVTGHVTLSGNEYYGGTILAKYNKATYASKGSGSDENGEWQWYRDGEEIAGANKISYIISKGDIGKVLKAKYTLPKGESFQGTVEASTGTIEKAVCENMEITNMESRDREGVLTMRVTGTKEEGDEIYYRLQEASDKAPVYPNTAEQLKEWETMNGATIDIVRDANHLELKANGTYILYYIKKETETHKGSAVISKSFTMGTKSQTGTIAFSGDFIVGKNITATLKEGNNTKGTWHWYMSSKRYGYDGLSSMPESTVEENWIEITGGFSPVLNEASSTLAITDEMFAHYIRAEFVADSEQGYSGEIKTTDEQFAKKIYNETITIESSTKDGNGKPKAYSNSVISGTVNQYAESGKLERTTIQFKIANSDGSGITYISGNELTITGNRFTYTMPNNQSYDGKEITAEVSTPKYPGLFVKEDRQAIEGTIVNSKESTKTTVTYSYGIPISSSADMKQFMLAQDKYTDRSAYYILTSDIRMLDSDALSQDGMSSIKFSGTLDGDFHTITNLRNQVFKTIGGTSSKFSVVKNLIGYNANIYITSSASLPGGNSSGIFGSDGSYIEFENVFLMDSKFTAPWNTGYFLGRPNGTVRVKNSGAAGGSISTTGSGASFGGIIGYLDLNAENNLFQNIFTINSVMKPSASPSSNGGICGSIGKSGKLINVYTTNDVAITPSNNTGPIIGNKASNGTYENVYYNEDSLGDKDFPFINSYGIRTTTKNLIGDNLKSCFDKASPNTWRYNNGYYPRLSWIADHPIAKLYSATRGAFISVDGKTSNDNMFNGNISGVIQIPTELQTKDYTVTSSNDAILKIGDNGTIIPVGDVNQKAVITITYTEPDETISGSASNTYEFTVKEKVQAMPSVTIHDETTNTELTGNPKMNQVLQADSVGIGSSYQWYRRKSGTTEKLAIEGATAQNYTVKPGDIGYELTVLVKAAGYASAYSNFTMAVTAIKPEAPNVSKITDSSVVLKPVYGEEGLTYEFGYVRADENAGKMIAEETCASNGSVTVKNLERNKRYNFFVRVAAKVGNYEAGDWSDATSKQLEQTVVEGAVLLGTAINNGTELTMRIESVNGQTGTWKLERLAANEDMVEAVIHESLSTENEAKYTLTSDDVGKRIKATYIGRGNYKGEKSKTTEIIKKTIPSTVPSSPEEVEAKKTDSTLTVQMKAEGIYDIGFAESANAEIDVRARELEANREYRIEGLKRNTTYYIYARTSEGQGTEASNWSQAGLYKTAKTEVAGELSITGNLMTDGTMKVKAPAMNDLTGIWKVERIMGGNTTTIAPKDYQVDSASNTISYQPVPRDAQGRIKVTFTGTGDYQGAIIKTSSVIQNAKQDNVSDMPEDVIITNTKDHTADVAASSGKGVYQYGYAPKGETASILWNDATGEAGKAVRLSGMERDSEYDIYVRKAAKTGYDASDPVKLPSQVKTEKTALNGSLDYYMEEGDYKVGIAEIGRTYTASYTSGKYEQSGQDEGGSWQWYADDKAIAGATSAKYTIEAMKGTPEISVRYSAREGSGFDSFVKISIGTLTKPVYEAPSVLPQVTAMGEDGEIGSKLKITSADIENVYYYVQKADNIIVPSVIYSDEAAGNEVGLDRWFRASADITVTASADTEYVVYAARLEDGGHQNSGVISQRAVRTAKEELDKLNMVQIKEADNTKWKVLQDKELHIDIGGKAVDGIWQYYVTKNSIGDNSWQNITSEIETKEGKTAEYSYARVNMPVKYYDYYIKVVFTGRGSFRGNKIYTSTESLIGTQIKGSVQITSGDSSQVFTPVVASYVFAKNPDGTEITDERNGIWRWYRETGIGTNKYALIEDREEHIGLTDSYTPTAKDVGKKIYAEYTGAPTGLYSGSVQSNYLSSVAKSEQTKPTGLSEKQVNGTKIQVVLPDNYRAEGKSIPDVIVEYRVKDSDEEWTINDNKTTWIGSNDRKLRANTAYEIRARFAGTSEYKPSAYSELLYATTANQSFDEEHLSIIAPEQIETNTTITAVFTGDGYDEGYFSISRSDGTVISERVDGTIGEESLFKSGTNTIQYTVSSDDIGNNIIIKYIARKDAQTYGGSIEKNTKEVAKPVNPTKPGSSTLETVRLSETTLKVKVNDRCEYIFNESTETVPELSGEWSTLEKDENGYHTFTGLSKEKEYYLHTRYHETADYRYSEEDVSAGTKPWASAQYTITYQGTEGATNTNPTQYTELSNEIILSDASKDGYTFTGWTVNDGDTPVKGLKIVSGSEGDKTFTAHWMVNTYSIRYTLNDGTMKEGESNPETYTIETDSFTLKNPERKGYTFLGWTWEGEATPKTEVTISKGSFGNKIYIANWQVNTYQIQYELDGGINHTDNPSSYRITDMDITLKAPTRIGHVFLGWRKDGIGDVQETVTIVKGSTGDQSYSAVWQKKGYTVTFDSREGSAVLPVEIKYEEKITKPIDPIRTGYTFVGWFKEDALENEWKFDSDAVKENVTLYAKWTVNEYQAVFDGNGGETEKPGIITRKYQEELGTLPTATRAGYTFIGWYSEKTGGTKISEETKMPVDGATYYAQWRINEYTAKFDGNGGTNGADIKKEYGKALETLPASSRTGYSFMGWYSEKTGGTKISEETKMPAKNTTYYAQWKAIEYSITYDLGDSEARNHEDNPMTYTIESEDITLQKPIWKGHDFIGWTWEGENTPQKIVTIAKGTHETLSYTAHWKLKEYMVDFQTNSKSTISSMTVEYGGKIARPKEDPVKDGYVFEGWYADEECTIGWNFDMDTISGDTVLYAGYKEILKSVESDTISGTSVEKGAIIRLSAPKGANIYYTLDGTEPTDKDQRYSEGIVIEKTITIKAIAVKEGYVNSHTATFTYQVRGKVSIETGNGPIRIDINQKELLEAVLLEEEYQEYLSGTNVKVRIHCEPISKQEDEMIQKLLEGRTVAHGYDITVYKTIGDKEEVVETLQRPIRLVLEVPKEASAKEGVIREFMVLRLHEGKDELLEDLDEEKETVTFESDVFSYYLLCYRDIRTDEQEESKATQGKHTGSSKKPSQEVIIETYEKEEIEKDSNPKNDRKGIKVTDNTLCTVIVTCTIGLIISAVVVWKKRHKKVKK